MECILACWITRIMQHMDVGQAPDGEQVNQMGNERRVLACSYGAPTIAAACLGGQPMVS